jgi:hypothetical protein
MPKSKAREASLANQKQLKMDDFFIKRRELNLIVTFPVEV